MRVTSPHPLTDTHADAIADDLERRRPRPRPNRKES